MHPSGARGEPMRRHCGTHAKGHDPNHLLVLRYAPKCPALTIDDIDAPGDDVVRLLVEGAQRRLHNHAPHEVIEAWEARTGVAIWTPDAALVQIPNDGGRACFSVSWTPLGPCEQDREDQRRTNMLFKAIIDEVIADGVPDEGGRGQR
jgi:hypothetical protein